MKTALEFLKEDIEETNIPEEHYEWEIAEMMDWYADYYHESKVKNLTIPRVSQRSELLKAFYAYIDDKWALGMLTDKVDEVVEGFEKSL
jgi:hypothetical protein